MDDIKRVIEAAFERRADISPEHGEPETREAVAAAIALLDAGEAGSRSHRSGAGSSTSG